MSNNPEGIDKLWPKSYIVDFYESLFRKKKLRGQLNTLIEINNKNNNSILLWKSYFSKLKVFEFKFINNNLLLDEHYAQEFPCDIVIINKANDIKNLNNLVSLILPLLNKGGHLVIEDIGFKSKEVFLSLIKTPLSYKMKLFDFRVKRFLNNNCILSIKRNENSSILNSLMRCLIFFQFIFFLSINIVLRIIPTVFNTIKKIY
ncbi:hypothetical protein N9V09_03930 [Prochlorococcus sp. AH-736-K20]|nr:hypothetical protein [Prochlorococcus sp. AH-736-K20]MDA9746543.1 hypothetical protein [Prochlorococcus sp. AH-736-K20]